MDYNGPVSPELVDAVVASDADVVAFYPYLYHPTVGTIGKVRVPAVLHPAAHDEPALYLPVFRGTFGNADAFCFHTASERQLVERMYPVAERPQMVLGLGVGESEGTGRPGGALAGLGERPYIVSVGRVDEHKGSKMLASYFATYKERHPGPLALALVGPVSFELPPHPDIVVTGAVDEPDKWDIVRDALVAVSPSALESFSLVVVEAWVDRVPVLVNGACGPTREHCERSGGGLWFTSYPEFEAVLDRLVSDPACAPRSGPGPGLRGPALPVAGVDQALRRVPDDGGGAGEGHPEPVLTAASDGRAARGCDSEGDRSSDDRVHGLVDGVVGDVVGQVVALGVQGRLGLPEAEPGQHGDDGAGIDRPPIGQVVLGRGREAHDVGLRWVQVVLERLGHDHRLGRAPGRLRQGAPRLAQVQQDGADQRDVERAEVARHVVDVALDELGGRAQGAVEVPPAVVVAVDGLLHDAQPLLGLVVALHRERVDRHVEARLEGDHLGAHALHVEGQGPVAGPSSSTRLPARSTPPR